MDFGNEDKGLQELPGGGKRAEGVPQEGRRAVFRHHGKQHESI